jgi:SAM-dependent methyltransferase
MRPRDDVPLDRLLAEQIGYYRALAPEYGDHAIDAPGGGEMDAALKAFAAAGDVLELACGPGTWTAQLARQAASVTAVDASPEMLAMAAARVGDAPVHFVCADVFRWRPDRRYDVVFRRRLNDGTAHRIVKVAHRPADLEERLRRLGWDITVRQTAGPFFWGAGSRA